MNLQNQGLFRIIGWLTIGLILGAGLGLFLGWVVWPTRFTEADPTVLEEEHKRDYTLMIASTYWEDEDLNAAMDRLDSIGEEDPFGWYRAVTLDHILGREDDLEIRHLVNLAADLGIYSQAMDPYWPGTFED
jgi:hypothetical protein